MQAYKDLHDCMEDTLPITNKSVWNYTDIDFIAKCLQPLGVSSNYNEPMTMEQVKRLGFDKCVNIADTIDATKNLVNIQTVHAKDLKITDTDKYDYVMTYSFPCQDLSKAGKGAGMAKGSGTRSGMLWEVERLLDECSVNGNLPQVLLMENVPDVIGTKNIEHFAYWVERLEKMGYKCYWRVLNAKDYGIPQNRECCFMVSILGDYLYEFPKPIKLEKRLKDLLENEVDEKFYLSDKAIEGAIKTSFCTGKIENKLPKDGICGTLMARDYKDPRWVAEPQLIELTSNQSQGNRVYDPNGLSVTLSANGGGRGAKTGLYAVDDSFVAKRYAEFVQENGYVPEMFNPYNRVEITDVAPTQTTNCGSSASSATVLVKEETLKRQLCNELITSGKVSEGDVIRHSYSNSRMQDTKISNAGNHDCCPTLDTRCDCLGVVRNYRIRKLTPRECFRLMGVRDSDYEKVAKNQSNASLYHLAGDSIVVAVLVAILGQMVEGFDFNEYIKKFYKQMEEHQK